MVEATKALGNTLSLWEGIDNPANLALSGEDLESSSLGQDSSPDEDNSGQEDGRAEDVGAAPNGLQDAASP